MQQTAVLIVGAGPTGLMAAAQLQRWGVPFLLIDQKEGPTRESRALVLHARSLELYEGLGLADRALREGEVVRRFAFIAGRRKVLELPVGEIGKGLSPYPFLLILEQSRNEALLYDHLRQGGGSVQWRTELLRLQEGEGKVRAEVRVAGSPCQVEADWVIAADGARSTVRHYLDIPFRGATYEHIFYVADTAVEWPWGHDAVSVCLSRQSFLGLFPMPGKNRFRVVGILPKAFRDEPPQSFEQIVPLIRQQAVVPLQFHDTSWFSVYRLHHRCIERFRQGRTFFAGDAAHVHSPAGGQGMNTGLQDAANLCWKLALVIRGEASPALLDTYGQERQPFARQLVATTDRAFSLATSGRWYNRWLRLYVFPLLLPLLFRFERLRKLLFRTLSQIGIRYIDSDLTLNRVSQSLSIKAGERFPYLHTGSGTSVYQLLQDPCFYLLLFRVNGQDPARWEELQQAFAGRLRLLDLSGEAEWIRRLRIRKSLAVVVRPDHYIGLVTDEGVTVVRNYLKQWLIPSEQPLAPSDGSLGS